MQVYEIVRDRQKARGINVAELSRRTGIKYESLRISLDGGRGITGSELIFLCRELDLEVSDFDSIDPISDGYVPSEREKMLASLGTVEAS